MQSITRVALGLGAAALVASGGSAFTLGAPLPANEPLAHGQADVAGVTINNIRYVPLSTNANQLDYAEFTTTTLNITNTSHSMIMTTSTTAGAGNTGTQHPCTISPYTTGSAVISCPASTVIALDTLASVGLTVTPK